MSIRMRRIVVSHSATMIRVAQEIEKNGFSRNDEEVFRVVNQIRKLGSLLEHSWGNSWDKHANTTAPHLIRNLLKTAGQVEVGLDRSKNHARDAASLIRLAVAEADRLREEDERRDGEGNLRRGAEG